MLCEARVGLSDWPLGDRRDVDPKHEKIQGLLRAGYIVPLYPAPTQTGGFVATHTGDEPVKPVAAPRRARRPAGG